MGALSGICCNEDTQRSPNHMKEILMSQTKSHFLKKKIENKSDHLEDAYSTNTSNFSPKSSGTNTLP